MNNPHYKPAGYNSVSAYFVIEDADRFIGLMKTIFYATGLREYRMPDGSVMHAELRIDDSVVMIGEASERFPAVPMVMHVYVPDAGEVYRRAIGAGCESVEEPTEREGDPDRRATFRDYAGNLWSVGTRLKTD